MERRISVPPPGLSREARPGPRTSLHHVSAQWPSECTRTAVSPEFASKDGRSINPRARAKSVLSLTGVDSDRERLELDDSNLALGPVPAVHDDQYGFVENPVVEIVGEEALVVTFDRAKVIEV